MANMPTISNTEQPGDVCPLCGGLGYVRENVPVGHPDFGKMFPCRCKKAELEKRRMDQLLVMSNLGHLAHMTFESFCPDGYGLPPEQSHKLHLAFDLARHYADHPSGWLLLFGGYGCGKTHLAAAIANQVIARGQPALFVVVPDLLDHLRATYSPHSVVTYDDRFEGIRNAPLLVLDDLGTQSSTAWAQEKLFQILNYRYNAQLPTVITSNQPLDEIDPRIRSRMVDPGLVVIINIEAPDFRRGGAAIEQSELSSLHLLGDMTFDSFSLREGEDLDPEVRENLQGTLQKCREYAHEPQGWLVLAGVYGCGKTHLAAAMANEQRRQGRSALFVVVPDLLDHLRATFSPMSPVRFDKRFDQVRTAPFLVMDDLGTESASPWAQEKLYQLFNHRYMAHLPTVITTTQELEDIDPRLRTRMLDQTRCTYHLIKAPAYRTTTKKRDRRRRS